MQAFLHISCVQFANQLVTYITNPLAKASYTAKFRRMGALAELWKIRIICASNFHTYLDCQIAFLQDLTIFIPLRMV